MSSLYQCRTRVGYRPFKSDKLIVFDERQIQEVSIDLKWQPGLGNLNQDSTTTPTGATNALNQSKCSVTISDPYLSGLAWPVLYDAAAIYTSSNVAAANNIIFPACGEGQDPVADKCFKYVDIEADSAVSSGGDFAFIIISLWYEVKGTTFGTDFYFRVDGFGISHGSNFPNVTIKGVEARSILFNQSLLNLTFDEGAEIEKVLKDIAERFDYNVSFCLNSNADPQKKRLLPRSIRFKGVTADEAIQKVLDSVGGTSSTLPLREYANKITMCTRGEFSSRSCSVFYLGKGLYERYEINGQPQLTLIGQNQEFGLNRNDEDPYKSQSFESTSYVIQDLVPNRRKQELEKVKKIPFPKLFDPVSKHIADSSRGVGGTVWKTTRPAPATSGGKVQVTPEKVKDTNLFGVAPNGTNSISFLRGTIREADASQGRVVIATKFGLRVCKQGDNSKCFHRQIFQESTGLSSIKVKVGDEVEENREIGTSTTEKPEFIRFFITGHGAERVTLLPQLVWDWAVPEGEFRRFAQSASSPITSENRVTPPTLPPPTSQRICFRMGDSGSSTGPHLHAQWDPRPRPITTADVRKYVDVAGSVPATGNFGDRGGGHKGVDISNSLGTPMCLKEGVVVKQVADAKCPNGQGRGSRCGKPGFEGFGNVVIISTPEGDMLLAHLDSAGIPPNITGLRSSSGGGNTRPNIQSNPVTTGLALETSFKGVPRALRIIPGQTILSFISDYDDWLENGGPRGQDSGRDPGIWIPKRFSNWFITECNYKWRSGDLRIDLEGKNAWGTSEIAVPTFAKYLETMKKSGDVKTTSDYYGYIRSIGDLNWKVEQDGQLKDSTEVFCKEAQDWAAGQESINVSLSTSPATIQDSFPSANCEYVGTKYPRDKVNALIRAARSVGINNRAAYAGILGNGVVESTFQGQFFNPLANNGNRRYGFDGCVGVFQWCDRRAGLRKFAQSSGKSEFDFNTQLRFFVAELTAGSGYTDIALANGIIQKLNSARSPEEAANIFNSLYERAPGQAEQKRRNAAREIFNQMRCSGK